MKEVNFGFSNSDYPTGAFDGIGATGYPAGPVKGEFIGIVRSNDENYLVSKTTMAFKDEGIGRFDVRRALADIYNDGGGILYTEQMPSHEAMRIAAILNNSNTNENLERGVTIQEFLGMGNPNFAFQCVTQGNTVLATSIKPGVFDHKKELLSRSNRSFSDMQEELERNYQMMEEAERRM